VAFPHSSRRSRQRRRCALAIGAVVIVSSGCGVRVSHDAVVAAANGAAVASTAGTQDGSASTGTTGSVPGSSGTSGQSGLSGLTGSGGTSGNSVTSGTQSNSTGKTTATGASTGGGGSATGTPILVGSVGTYSGPVGGSYLGGDTMLRVWAAWTNDHGGIDGHPVKVFIADDQSDPNNTRAIVQDMVENKHVVAFVGNLWALTAQAPVNYLESKRVPVVGGDSTAPWHESWVYFPQGSYFFNMIIGGAQAAAQAGGKNLGYLYCTETTICKQMYDTLVTQGNAKKVGLTPKYSARISFGQVDFTAECLNAKNAGVDVLGVAADTNTISRVATSCGRQGYHPIFLGASTTVSDSQQSNPNLEGMITTQQWFPWPLTTGPGATYQAAMHKYAPGLTNSSATAAVWAAGELFTHALAHIGSGPVTSAEILDALWQIKNDRLGGLTPPLTFNKNKPADRSKCYFVVRMVNHKWTAPYGDSMRCVP
jgi:branched-chain amino acid transport system substrate-binding protein